MYEYKVCLTIKDLGRFLDEANSRRYEIITVIELDGYSTIIYKKK